ncbi:MAG: hypothetical protein CMB80_30150 [Flammeovirgaceae bacterium]|nr:hypothetical protein [Flammeovirgaceae bacterium]
MKILFTTHQGELAGSTMSIYYLSKGLAERGHQIHVGVRKGTLLWQKLSDIKNLTLHDLQIDSYIDWKACQQIKKIVRDNHVQILNAQGGKDRNLTILSKWMFGLNVKIVFTRRQRPRNEPWLKRWFHARGTAKIIMISNGLKEIFISRGYHPDHLKVIHNAVPSNLESAINQETVEALKAQYAIGGKTVVGCISRKKSQEQLLEAFKYLPEEYIGLFVGIHEEEVEVMLVSSLKQRFIFTGLLNHEEALHHLKLMNVNVLPSYLDGFGLVLVESMLLQVPVVGSNFGGIPDVIEDGKTGLLFENGNPRQLAEQIRRIIEDKQLSDRLEKEGKKVAKAKFSVENMLNNYEDFFQSIL